jgi:hypothetical protein
LSFFSHHGRGFRPGLLSVGVAVALIAMTGADAAGGVVWPAPPLTAGIREAIPTGLALPETADGASVPVATTVGALIKALAADGIATVRQESSHTPLAPVSGPLRMSFTQAQVNDMALQAVDHGGTTGAALDAAVPLPHGYPPFAYILAGWASTAKTAGAATTRRIMGTQDWHRAPTIVFPSAALALFTADVMAASPEPAHHPSAKAAAGFSAGGTGGSACSLASNFIDSVLATVFSALQLNAPTGPGVGAKVGSFFVGIWNSALGLAQNAVGQLPHALVAVGDG